MPSAASYRLPISGARSEPRDLSGLYVLTFDKSQSVESIIEKLKQLDDVVYAEPNYIRRAFGTAIDYTSASFFDKQWYLQAINIPYLWEQPIVKRKQLSKGVYIINNKKVVIK